jgi:hypothetical protein
MDDQPKTVTCPAALRPLFLEAEKTMTDFFADIVREPEKGQIHVQGVRYMLMRTDSMSIELHEELRKTFGDAGARQIRYKLAKACGMQDAKLFAERFGIDDPAMRLALGPVHFAQVGWANVDVFEESAPQPNEDYFLAYDHPFSFEAAAYLEQGIVSEHPVCHMNAGYSTGWCQVSFGVDLQAEELSCRARGDDQCIFVMAHPRNFASLRDEFARARGLR